MLQATGIIELTPGSLYTLNQSLGSGKYISASFSIQQNSLILIAIDAKSGSSGTAVLVNADSLAIVDEWNVSSGTTNKGLLPLHPGTYLLTITSDSSKTYLNSMLYGEITPHHTDRPPRRRA